MHALLTFVSVGHEDAGHEFFLAVVAEGVPDHDLLLCQLTLQIQGVPPVEWHLGWGSNTHTHTHGGYVTVTCGSRRCEGIWTH